jgi:MoaA/NifB/PqqE/SkfB family radical SAM enzyme
MIRYAAEQGVPYITFNTNGHPLRGKMAEQIAASEVDEIRVSVDGTDEDTYRKIRGVSLERLRENIREFKKLSDVPIAISATLSRDNWDNLKALPGLAEEIGAFCIRLYPVAPYTYLGVEDLGLSNEQKKQYKEYCADLKARCQAKGIHFAAISHKALTCNVPFIMAFVDIDSNLTVCCRLETNVVGNILKDGFRNAWRSPAMTAWRKRMLSGKFPKLCTDLECIHDWR